jgi:hypothetical protein
MSVRILPSVGLPATTQQPRVAAVDPQLLEILGPPPILESESLDSYNALHDRVRSAVAPADVIEELWVRDVVDLSWRVLRLRRMKSKLFAAKAHQGLKAILAPHFDNSVSHISRLRALVGGWAARDKASMKLVEKTMRQAGFDQASLEAATLAASIDAFERIERLMLQAEARRNAALCAIDRRREGLARRLRDAVTAIEDAEFTDVPAQPRDQEAA